jgi:hypothetical protein
MLTGHLTGISQVIEGDLIYSKESRLEEANSVGTSEADDGHTNSSDLDISSEILPEENIQSVKVCYKPKCLYTKCSFSNTYPCTFVSLVDSRF